MHSISSQSQAAAMPILPQLSAVHVSAAARVLTKQDEILKCGRGLTCDYPDSLLLFMSLHMSVNDLSDVSDEL